MKSRSKSVAAKDTTKIRSAIGNRVSFHYAEEGILEGTLKDREVRAAGGGYYQVIDLIEYSGGRWIRMGFYRRVGRRLIWASRSAPSFSFNDWKAIFIKAKKKEWFGSLLKASAQE